MVCSRDLADVEEWSPGRTETELLDSANSHMPLMAGGKFVVRLHNTKKLATVERVEFYAS
jgi:hypothetical protein